MNLTLEGLVTQTIVGAKVLDLCAFGTTVMEAATSKLYTKKVNGKAIDRGVAFPVCVSVNDIVCNFSPLEGLPEVTVSFKLYYYWRLSSSCFLFCFSSYNM